MHSGMSSFASAVAAVCDRRSALIERRYNLRRLVQITFFLQDDGRGREKGVYYSRGELPRREIICQSEPQKQNGKEIFWRAKAT